MAETINPDDPKAADVHAALMRLFVDLADRPAEAPRSYAGLARMVGIDTATLWRHRKASGEVANLAEQIVRTGKAGRLWDGATATGAESAASEAALTLAPAEEGGLGSLPLEEVEHRAARSLQKARWALQRFVGRRKYHDHPSDLPRAIFELEQALMQARSQLQIVRPLTEEWLRRRNGGTAQRVGAQHDLALDLNQPDLE